jgi:hypothetical protein
MTDRNSPEDRSAKRASVIDSMILSISKHEDRHYFVGLVGYYIEGIRYSASGLSVDLSTTPDICRTDAGFACSATFPADIIEPKTAKVKATKNNSLGGPVQDIVRVRLEVIMDDIWSVAEFIDGRQCDLFIDPEALRAGMDRSWSKPY